MRNIKLISIFAAIGFALSFLFGLISRAKIYIILLRALIFAIVFALIGFLISFLVKKFLVSDDGDIDISPNPEAESGEVSSKGHKVDFVVQDDELDRSESENHFIVGDNRQMLNNSDFNSASNANLQNLIENDKKADIKVENANSEEKSSFVPLRTAETVVNFSGKEAKFSDQTRIKTESESKSPPNLIKDKNLNNDEEIDVLPDMSSMDFSSAAKNNSENVSDNQGDSIVNSLGDSSSLSSSRKNSSAEIEIKDASLMAKAISSVLSGEIS